MKREREKCSQEQFMRPDELTISINKGDVRRAVQGLARAIESAGVKSANDDGVALMMAILLVEKLANGHRRDPIVVLNKMARCFALKRERLQALRLRN